MKIAKSVIEKIVITDVPNLDAVAVMAEDFGPGQGKITITCFGEAWSAYWSHMGESNKLADFFCSCDEHYLAGKLSTGIRQYIDDDDESTLETLLKKTIVERRREDGITSEFARELWNKTIQLVAFDKANVCYEVLGDEWWYRTPKKINPEYEYLCRIIKTVQAALILNNEKELEAA